MQVFHAVRTTEKDYGWQVGEDEVEKSANCRLILPLDNPLLFILGSSSPK